MRALSVATILGLGTALVFGAAALTATLFPNGSMVTTTGWSGGPVVRGGWNGGGVPVPAPVPMPAVEAPARAEGGIAVPDPAFKALPGDTVPADDGGLILETVPDR